MTVIVPVPAVQLLKVFPVIVLGVATLERPSVLLMPLKMVAPVTVMLEKLLLVCVVGAVAAIVLAPEVMHATVPPLPALLNAVTIEFPEMV